MEGHILETPVKLSATYGLRRSEVLGLRWSSVDFEDKTITIDHTAVQCKTEILYDDTAKSASSLRSFPLTPSMEEYLSRIKSRQEAESSRYGPAYTHSDYVCRREDGTLIKPAYVTQLFPKFLVDNDMPRIRFHDLRHSSASLLINAGFTLKEVQEWLGHSDINSTNIYSHLLYKSKENMADKVEKMLGL